MLAVQGVSIPPPVTAPLDSCLRRNDEWGAGERRETETPPRRAPALDSRFRGNDEWGECGPVDAAGGGGEGPALAGRAVREPAPTVMDCARFSLAGSGASIPLPATAPLDCWLRGDDAWGREGPSTGSGRTESRTAPTVIYCVRFSLGGPAVSIPRPAPLWIPAFAGMTHEGAASIPREGDGIRRAALLLWIPAFAGMTYGGRGPPLWLAGAGDSWWGPALAGRAFRETPLR